MGVGTPDLREEQVEKMGLKLEKCSISQGFEGGTFYHLFRNRKNISHFTILTPNTLSDFIFVNYCKNVVKNYPISNVSCD